MQTRRHIHDGRRQSRPHLNIQRSHSPIPPGTRGELRFIPLGGCGEVQRSTYIYEYNDDIVIIDMGLQFPDEDMPGIDYLIANVEYLKP
ncbi:MAG: Beta-lactamase domain protein, partial [Parcubacteria group bacterium GW2011_GWB1_50_9]